MTEKRYFKRMWEEEYYIFDSETISEKEFDEKVEYEDYRAFEDSMQGDEVVNRLNELNDENQDLKEQVGNDFNEANSMTVKIAELTEENEQLKKENKEYIRGLELRKVECQSWASDVRELREQNCQLEKENEQLKSQIEHLKVKIDRERTATTKQHLKWDKEVQKQLTEQGTQIDFLKNENQHMRTVINENMQLKKLLRKISNSNSEIWLSNGQIIRLKKIFKGEWVND